jgi:hypothetical protein
MKNQYFGDINDYIKYTILRQLSRSGTLRIGVCWMLTESDQRTDGQTIGYLERPESFRAFSPEVFDCLRRSVIVERARRVVRLEESGLLHNSAFHSTLLTDNRHARALYFAEMRETLADADLVFFDPDNGLEVPSVHKGRKGSSKYLFLDEVAQTYSAGHSLLIYQHFPREPRDQFTSRLAQVLLAGTSSDLVMSFRTARVVFFLVSQADHERHFRTQAAEVASVWGRQQVVVTSHSCHHCK